MENSALIHIVLAFSCFAAAYFYTRFLITFLKRFKIFDVPNARSNHKTPVVRGGGIAITDTSLAGFLIISYFITNELSQLWPVFLGMLTLALVSLIDDMKGLSAAIRFGAQLFTVFLTMSVIESSPSNGAIPSFIEHGLMLAAWLWFINLYNFMDGIDGITSVETISICIGIVLLSQINEELRHLTVYAVILLGATAGFLIWNWSPAKIFMGDVGSVAIGYILGFFLLLMASHGFWVEALILPLYYLADSSITLCKRLANGEKIWQAHSKHFYQQAVRKGKSHAHVSSRIAYVNLLLIALALIASYQPELRLLILLLALLMVGGLLRWLSK